MAIYDVGEQFLRNPGWLVAIDTSSDRAGVALFDGERANVIAWNAHRNHTVDTLRQVDHLLRLAGLELADLSGIAVATGPGSFSALRVGLSIGKGLAFAQGLPLVGVPTTDAIAATVAWAGRPVIAVMTAGRGRVVWTRYLNGLSQAGPRNTSVEELRAVVAPGDLVTGEVDRLQGVDVIPAVMGARVEQVARIGWRRLQAGEADDASRLEPIYAHGRRAKDSVPA
ncbi:MAG: tRNA (adenosine(37)-N6)-threonylcarbamoyltransferase complex dimerization subunit type 1 TsaB [Thermomicrobiales bacterium]|nr:tRNA (adenosine(37)-N6)-threonylcarbamoyltransferase complex dimerization subunit type 1 TsaB [Thermomicrobiales bacterium]